MACQTSATFDLEEEKKRDQEEFKKEEDEDDFLNKLRGLSIGPFMWQEEMILESPRWKDCDMGDILENCMDKLKLYQDRVDLKGMDLGDVKHFSVSELREFTNDFSQDNFFCVTRHGGMFRGQIKDRKVAIKTLDFWMPPTGFYAKYVMPRLADDITLLRDPLIKAHPNFVKLIGYCCETKMAFVLDVDPIATVHQLLTVDAFGWEDRMKVARDFGNLLKFSHENLIIFGCVDAKCILIDEDFETKFFEFGFHSRVKNKSDTIEFEIWPRCIGYLAPEVHAPVCNWSMESDVYGYGILLLNLISKRDESRPSWAVKELETGGKKSLVSDAFEVDEYTGSRITELAMSCVRFDRASRPYMETVVKNLEDLIGDK